MGRQYVASTPATRGEVVVDEDAHASLFPDGMSHDQAVEALTALAAELGYTLEPVKVQPEKPEDEPAGNASTDAWVEYAKKRGALDADLLDEDGKALGQKALREKFGTPAAPAE